jgi:hypothetical protein
MSGSVGIDLPPGQAYAIKQVGSVRDQSFRQKRSPAARDQKEKKKEAETRSLAGSDKGRVRHDGTGGVGSEEQHERSRNKSKKENDSEVPGSLVDVII